MAWTSPKTWSVAEKVTAALMNTHLRDNLLYLFSSATISPTVTKRQGGSATDWSTQGTTTYTPATVTSQVGGIAVPVPAGSVFATVTVTYPTAWSNIPMIFVSCNDPVMVIASAYSIGLTTFTLQVNRSGTLATTNPINPTVYWFAVGSG